MIPAGSEALRGEVVFGELPGKTYALRETEALHGRYDGMLSGHIDGLEAVRQAIYLILSVERYRYVIYSWNYGVELADLYGKPMPYVMPEVKRRIREALMQDSRVKDVQGFTFERDGHALTARFEVRTAYGDVRAEKTVAV